MVFVEFSGNYDEGDDQNREIYEQNAPPAQSDINCPHFDSSKKKIPRFYLSKLSKLIEIF